MGPFYLGQTDYIEKLNDMASVLRLDYGAFASDPTVNPAGGPIAIGSEYFNTASNVTKRFNGTTWQASDLNTANLAAPGGSSTVGYLPAGTGAQNTTVETKLRESVSVFDFMTSAQIAVVKTNTYGGAVTNVSTSVQNAINTGKRVFFPAGTYLCNVTANNKLILEGEGSTVSLIQPFNAAVAAITYKSSAPYWTYHSIVTGIGFIGVGTKTGIGFTFGGTTQAEYYTNAEYSNNVSFHNCRFSNLNKGTQFLFGNIGSEFYSCGFSGNKYGVYTKNNATGNLMHAGNKYFYAGEFSSNECAFYCHNAADGFGGVSFKDTIFETNLISTYIHTVQDNNNPIIFDGVWFEKNGAVSTGAATVTIDSWSGTTRSDQTLTKRNLILDGTKGTYSFQGCGILCDIYLKATYTQVTTRECRIEFLSGYGGALSTVDTPDTSSIRMYDTHTVGGVGLAAGTLVAGAIFYPKSTIISDASLAWGRSFLVPMRSSKISSTGSSRVVSSALNTIAYTGEGTFNLTGTVVNDGRIYDTCNEFTRAAFGDTQYTKLTLPDSEIITTAGWYVYTLDFKRLAGNPKVYIWDRSTAQFIGYVGAPKINTWYTYAGYGYSPDNQTLYLDFRGDNTDCTWRVSAYQMHRFDTMEEAQSFLVSGAFVEPNELKSSLGSSLIGYLPGGGTFAVPTTIQDKLRTQLSILDFGADPTGVLDSSPAIYKAIEHGLNTRRTANAGQFGVPVGSYSSATLKVIFFPSGVYRVDSNLFTGIEYFEFVGERSVLIGGAGVTFFENVRSSLFRGLTFRGGACAISIKTGNIDSVRISVQDCEFYDQTQSMIRSDSVTLTPYNPANPTAVRTQVTGSQSTILNISNCKFIQSIEAARNAYIFEFGSIDMVNVDNCWITAHGYNMAAFYAKGVVLFNMTNCLLVPGGDYDNVSLRAASFAYTGRWFDWYGGALRLKGVRFGGESAGAPIVFNWANIKDHGDFPWISYSIVIDSCEIPCSIQSIRPLDCGVIVAKGGLPAMIRIVGCRGLVDSYYIRDGMTSETLLSYLTDYMTSATEYPPFTIEIANNNIRGNLLTDNLATTKILKNYARFNIPALKGTLEYLPMIESKVIQGDIYSQTSYTSDTSIVDTGIVSTTPMLGYNRSAVYDIIVSANPNAVGSDTYRHTQVGIIILGTGYLDAGAGSRQETNISYVKLANSENTAIPGALIVSAVFWDGASETTVATVGSITHQIRIKISGYKEPGYIGYGQGVRLIKRY